MKPGVKKVMREELKSWMAKNLLLAFTFSGVSLGVILGIVLRCVKGTKLKSVLHHVLR
jgi:hypothetical protein